MINELCHDTDVFVDLTVVYFSTIKYYARVYLMKVVKQFMMSTFFLIMTSILYANNFFWMKNVFMF